jgi:hypothetical protein
MGIFHCMEMFFAYMPSQLCTTALPPGTEDTTPLHHLLHPPGTADSSVHPHWVVWWTLSSTRLCDVNTAYKPRAICSYRAPHIVKTGPLVRITAVATGLAGREQEMEDEKTGAEEFAEHLESLYCKGRLGNSVLVAFLYNTFYHLLYITKII